MPKIFNRDGVTPYLEELLSILNSVIIFKVKNASKLQFQVLKMALYTNQNMK